MTGPAHARSWRWPGRLVRDRASISEEIEKACFSDMVGAIQTTESNEQGLLRGDDMRFVSWSAIHNADTATEDGKCSRSSSDCGFLRAISSCFQRHIVHMIADKKSHYGSPACYVRY